MTMTTLNKYNTTFRRKFILILVCLLLATTLPAADHASANTATASPIHVTAIAISVQQVNVSWTLTPGSIRNVSGFLIRRDGMLLATVDASTTMYSDTTVQPRSQYSYTVEALDATGKQLAVARANNARTPRLPDTTDTTPPTPPEELDVIAYPGYVLLDWYYSTDDSDVTAFLLRRNGQRLAVVPAGTMRYIDTDVQPGTVYAYTVEGIDTVGHHSLPEDAPSVTALTGTAPMLNIPSTTYLPLLAQSPAMSNLALAAKAASITTGISSHLTRYPYLTDLVDRYVTVNWATDKTGTTGSVKWGKVNADGSCTPNTTVTASYVSITVNSVGEYQWKANLTLTPDTQYCYRVYLGSTDLLGTNDFSTILDPALVWVQQALLVRGLWRLGRI